MRDATRRLESFFLLLSRLESRNASCVSVCRLEAAVVAKLTGRTLILPTHFAKWYRDDLSHDMIPFEVVFDAEPRDVRVLALRRGKRRAL